MSTFKSAEECIEKLKTMPFEQGLIEALQLRSDDFGHRCDLLLEAESLCLQYFGEQFLERIKPIEWPSDLEVSTHAGIGQVKYKGQESLSYFTGFSQGVEWLKERLKV